MSKTKWVIVAKVPGELQAELIRGMLESHGIPVMLALEGAARAIGITTGPLGESEILVPAEKEEQALEIIAGYRSGDFINTEVD